MHVRQARTSVHPLVEQERLITGKPFAAPLFFEIYD
jgi:hypothetical protein